MGFHNTATPADFIKAFKRRCLMGSSPQIEEMSSATDNPLHQRRPSAAYMESLARARANRHFEMDVPDVVRVPGWRTWVTAFVFLATGIITFIIGAVYYWNSTGEEQHNQGKDLLIIGGIMLLPGGYASSILFGAWMQWPGYHYHQVPELTNSL